MLHEADLLTANSMIHTAMPSPRLLSLIQRGSHRIFLALPVFGIRCEGDETVTADIARMPMQDRFQHLFCCDPGQRFLNKQGARQRGPVLYLSLRSREESVEMVRLQTSARSIRLEQVGIRIMEINLYDLSIEILKERDIWGPDCRDGGFRL